MGFSTVEACSFVSPNDAVLWRGVSHPGIQRCRGKKRKRDDLGEPKGTSELVRTPPVEQ